MLQRPPAQLLQMALALFLPENCSRGDVAATCYVYDPAAAKWGRGPTRYGGRAGFKVALCTCTLSRVAWPPDPVLQCSSSSCLAAGSSFDYRTKQRAKTEGLWCLLAHADSSGSATASPTDVTALEQQICNSTRAAAKQLYQMVEAGGAQAQARP